MRGSTKTPVVEQDSQVPGLSGSQEKISVPSLLAQALATWGRGRKWPLLFCPRVSSRELRVEANLVRQVNVKQNSQLFGDWSDYFRAAFTDHVHKLMLLPNPDS